MRMQEFLVFADLSLDNNVYKSIVLLALTLCTGVLLESLASLPAVQETLVFMPHGNKFISLISAVPRNSFTIGLYASPMMG